MINDQDDRDMVEWLKMFPPVFCIFGSFFLGMMMGCAYMLGYSPDWWTPFHVSILGLVVCFYSWGNCKCIIRNIRRTS